MWPVRDAATISNSTSPSVRRTTVTIEQHVSNYLDQHLTPAA
jgi:hypothetical protein